MVTTEIYQHETLNAANREIRLVQILPTDRDGRVRLNLKTVLLRTESETQDNSYIALSYAWGEDASSHPHWLGNRVMYLKDNIAGFIQNCLRHNTCLAPAWLWIDSICIDQQNLSEKSSHVLLMANIFTQATKVLIWLGAPSQRSIIAETYEDFSPRRPTDKADVPPPKTTSYIEQRVMGLEGTTDSPDVPLLHEIFDAFQSPYWSRVWVVQECALAHDPRVIFGQYQLSLFHIGAMAARLAAFEIGDLQDMFEPSLPIIVQRAECQLSRITDLASAGSNLRNLSLEALMAKFTRQKCTIMRDKIYGLLGLLHMAPEIIATVKIDYQCSFEAILPSVLQIMNKSPPRTQILHEPTSPKMHPMENIRTLKWRFGLDASPEWKLQESVEQCIATGPAEDSKALTDDVLVYSTKAERWVAEAVDKFKPEHWLSIGPVNSLKPAKIGSCDAHSTLRTLLPCQKSKLVEDIPKGDSHQDSQLSSPFLLHIEIDGLSPDGTIHAGALLGCTTSNSIRVVCFAAFERRVGVWVDHWKCAYLQHDRLRNKLQEAFNESSKNWIKIWPADAKHANDRPGDKMRDLTDQQIPCSLLDAVEFVEMGDAFYQLLQDEPTSLGVDSDGDDNDEEEDGEELLDTPRRRGG